MPLLAIAPPAFDIDLALAYATPDNVCGRPLYARAAAYLHRDAAACLQRAITLARPLGLRLRLFDAFRPTEAQQALWEACPLPGFVAAPTEGSAHSRGVAVDLTLLDAAGTTLDMGTAFDDFSPRSRHGDATVSPAAQRNRLLLLGLMRLAGFEHHADEWWHYHLPDAARYPLLGDAALGGDGLMPR